MTATTLLERKSISVSDFRCTAGPGDKPFAEQHSRHSISYVRKGSFGLHCRGKFSELVAGSVLIGHPGDEYTCTHEHVCGDECLSFFLAPQLVEAISDNEYYLVEKMLDEVVSLELDAVELGTGNYPGDAHCKPDELLEDAQKRAAYRQAIESRGLMISGLSQHGNPLHPDPFAIRSMVYNSFS